MNDLNLIKIRKNTKNKDCDDLMKRIHKSKKLPTISESMDVLKKIDLTYDYIVENQPIGQQLFKEFCQSNNSYLDCLTLLNFIQKSKYLIDNCELDATFIDIKTKLLQFYESRNLAQLIGCENMFAKLTELKNKKLIKKFLNPCELKIKHFLSIKVFKEFLTSIYFYRYLQWKKLEQLKIERKQFVFYSVIGIGGFCQVFSCEDTLTKKMYACKMYGLNSLKVANAQDPLALSEKKILEKLNSNFIVSLIYSFVTDTHLCMILPIMTGGSLDYHIRNRNVRPGLDYDSVQFYAAEIICGIEYLHGKHIIHLDIKPDNILLNDTGHVKITDFGLALELDKHSTVSYTAGTIGYMAPEVMTASSFRFSPDWFSFGCLLYEMIEGMNPFTNLKDSIDVVEHCVLHKREKYSHKFNWDAQHLCKSLLKKNPKDRIGYFMDTKAAKVIKNHRFFQSVNWNQIKYGLFEPPFIPDINLNILDSQDVGVKKSAQTENEIKFCEQFDSGINSIPWQCEILSSEVFSSMNNFTAKDKLMFDYMIREKPFANFEFNCFKSCFKKKNKHEDVLKYDCVPIPSISSNIFKRSVSSVSLGESSDSESDN